MLKTFSVETAKGKHTQNYDPIIKFNIKNGNIHFNKSVATLLGIKPGSKFVLHQDLSTLQWYIEHGPKNGFTIKYDPTRSTFYSSSKVMCKNLIYSFEIEEEISFSLEVLRDDVIVEGRKMYYVNYVKPS